MDPIGRSASVTGPGAGPAVRPARSGAAFGLPEPADAAPALPAAPAAALLALQESAVEPPREREARRRGGALLRELAGLQRDLLADRVDADRLARLRGLAADAPLPADPALRAAVEAVVLRARVELARFGRT